MPLAKSRNLPELDSKAIKHDLVLLSNDHDCGDYWGPKSIAKVSYFPQRMSHGSVSQLEASLTRPIIWEPRAEPCGGYMTMLVTAND